MTRVDVPNLDRRRPAGRFGRWVLILLLAVIAGSALWTWLTLAWAYADGERAGVLRSSCAAAGSARPRRARSPCTTVAAPTWARAHRASCGTSACATSRWARI